MNAQPAFRAFLSNLKKKKIIEILAAFIAGGWLFIEFVHFILIGHYHFPEKTLDFVLVTLIGILLCTLIWRWFSGREQSRKFKLEIALIPVVVLVTVLLDLNLLLHLEAPESETIAVAPTWKNSVAVLPFVDLSPQKDQESFCDGMTGELINRLSNIHELKVTARASAFFFKGKGLGIREIGKKLGVASVLDGTIQKVESSLRVQVQLINTADESNIWSEKFDREMKDVFEIHDEIALAVADKLKLTLLGEQKSKIIKHATSDVNAFETYLKGKYYRYEERPKSNLMARDYFKEAIRKDPSYAAAFAGLAESYMLLGLSSVLPRDEAAANALDAVKKALELDKNLSEAYVSMGVIKMVFDWDWKGAEAELQKAISQNPNNFDAHHEYGWLLFRTYRYDEAEKEWIYCQTLDPLNPLALRELRIFYVCRGQEGKAENIKKQLKEIRPDWAELTEKSSYSVEKESLNIQEQGRIPWSVRSLAIAYIISGNSKEALKLIEELELVYEDGHEGNVACGLADIFDTLGEKEKTLSWLERAVEKKAPAMINLSLCYWFKSVQEEPRFRALLKRVGLK